MIELFTQTDSGRYRPATEEEILEAASDVVQGTIWLPPNTTDRLVTALRGIASIFNSEKP